MTTPIFHQYAGNSKFCFSDLSFSHKVQVLIATWLSTHFRCNMFEIQHWTMPRAWALFPSFTVLMALCLPRSDPETEELAGSFPLPQPLQAIYQVCRATPNPSWEKAGYTLFIPTHISKDPTYSISEMSLKLPSSLSAPRPLTVSVHPHCCRNLLTGLCIQSAVPLTHSPSFRPESPS